MNEAEKKITELKALTIELEKLKNDISIDQHNEIMSIANSLKKVKKKRYFRAWILKRWEKGTEDWIDSLACEISYDETFPKGYITREQLRQHVKTRGYCAELQSTVDEAWDEFITDVL